MDPLNEAIATATAEELDKAKAFTAGTVDESVNSWGSSQESLRGVIYHTGKAIVHAIEGLTQAVAQEAVSVDTTESPLEKFVDWLTSLDEPGNVERQTITLTEIINRAREADPGRDLPGRESWSDKGTAI